MLHLLFDLLLVLVGMDIDAVLMCILQVRKVDTRLEEFDRRTGKWILDRIFIIGF